MVISSNDPIGEMCDSLSLIVIIPEQQFNKKAKKVEIEDCKMLKKVQNTCVSGLVGSQGNKGIRWRQRNPSGACEGSTVQ